MKQLVDKTAVTLYAIDGTPIIRDAGRVSPLEAVSPLSTSTVTAAQLVASGKGNIPVAMYKGALATWDLDKAVNQPLVTAERGHILGMLDGRTLNYDAVTATFVAGNATGTVVRARLTVPAGQVWIVHAVQIYAPKDTTGAVNVNWRCSLWPDQSAIPDADGQTFLATDGVGTNAIGIWNYLFGVLPVTTNIGSNIALNGPTGDLGQAIATPKTMPVPLRLPGGAVLTLQATVNAVNATIVLALPVTLSVRGYVAKALVA
jgi:hypothetical protein